MSMGKGRLERYQRLRDLAKRIVDDPRFIDGGTKAALKSAVLKYVATKYDDTTQALKNLYQEESEIGRLVRKAVAVVEHRDDRRHDASEDPVRAPAGDHHHASKVADLLHESGRFGSRSEALAWLLSHKDGAALLQRLHTHKGDDTMNNAELEAERTEKLRALVKSAGIVAVAKAIVDGQRAYGIDEPEFTRLATEHAQRLYPDKTLDAAFAKVFSDNGPDGVMLRKAHALTKGVFDIEPLVVGGVAATHDAVSDTESSEAYQQLEAMAAKLRESLPFLSSQQAFARVFEKNPALAQKAHRRPAATTSYAWPR
jgi:hypothetical protein